MKENKINRLPFPVLLILPAMVTLYVGWFTFHSIDAWANMNNNWWDFGNIDSAAYNTAQGKFMFSNARLYNYWSDHFAPILLVLSAYYLVGDGHWFIFFWQALTIGLAAVPLFLIAREVLKDERAALLISAAYLANGYVHMGNLFDYHMVSHMGLFALSAFYAMMKRRWGLYFLFGALLMACKEDAPIIFFMFGFYAAFVMKEKKWAALTWAVAGGYMLFVFGAAIPYFRASSINVVGDPGKYMYADNYEWMGRSIPEVLENIRTRSGRMIQALMEPPVRVTRWMGWITGYAFLPLITPIGLLMAAPSSLEIFLNGRITVSALLFHYPLMIAPLWTLAFILALPRAGRAAAFVHRRAMRLPPWLSAAARGAAGGAAMALAGFIIYSDAANLLSGEGRARSWVYAQDKQLFALLVLVVAYIALGGASFAARALGRDAGGRAITAFAVYILVFNLLVTSGNAPLMLTDDGARVYKENAEIEYDTIFINPAVFYTPEHREHARLARESLKLIPKDAVVVSSQEAYHFLNHNVNSFLYRGMDKYPFPEMEVEYAAIDLKSIPKAVGPTLYDNRQAVTDFLRNPDFGLVMETDGFLIFKRGAPKTADYRWYLEKVMTYHAGELSGIVGGPLDDPKAASGRSHAALAAGTPAGHLVFGPYIPLAEGDYEVVYRLRAAGAEEEPVVRLDVAVNLGREILAARILNGDDFAEGGGWVEVSLPFSVDEDGEERTEFRVYYYGGADVWVESVSLRMSFETFLSMAMIPRRDFWSYQPGRG
ncbi:MAG: DUF2079 domain-containing protein [Candidatus Nitrospinota bacterium M3_3B_026]